MKASNNKTSTIWELLTLAQEEEGAKTLTLQKATEILKGLGWAEKTEFTTSEVTTFLEAVQLVTVEQKTISQMRTALNIKTTMAYLGADVEKKSQALKERIAISLALMEQQIGDKILYLLPRVLQQWIDTGLMEAALNEARTRILQAEAGGIPLEQDYIAWCAQQESILQRLAHQIKKPKVPSKSHN